MAERFFRAEITTQAARELLTCFERYVLDSPAHQDEADEFDEIPLMDYALQAANVSPRTAVHKVLDDLSPYCFYTYGYGEDHLEVEGVVEEFRRFIVMMFSGMGYEVPAEFGSSEPDKLRRARDLYDDKFRYGLHNIVVSAFALAWERLPLLQKFNERMASIIKDLKKTDHVQLDWDGVLPRNRYWPTWLVNRLQYRARGRCGECGRNVSAEYGNTDGWHIDHIVPIALGGCNDPTNLRILCARA